MIGAAGNMCAVHEDFLPPHVDFVVDNDLLTAPASGLRAVRIRRGAHAPAESPPGTVTIGSLAELPGVRVLSRV